MPLQISRLDAAKLPTPYAGVSLATVYLRIEKLNFDLRQNTLNYDFALYASKAAMAATATTPTESLPIPELTGLNTYKVALTAGEQAGSQLTQAYEHLKAQLAAVAGNPYTVTDF